MQHAAGGWGPGGSPAQAREHHLEEDYAHAVHVELVGVVEAPQDGRQERCHRQGWRSGCLHTHPQVWHTM